VLGSLLATSIGLLTGCTADFPESDRQLRVTRFSYKKDKITIRVTAAATGQYSDSSTPVFTMCQL
jgi:hypothetical protein